MKTLSQDFEEHLKSGATTLANCWILRRQDGISIGFTDHDCPLEIDDILCEPETGLTGSEVRLSDGFASDDQDVNGIIQSDRINEPDLMAGRYDGATVETWRVNWQDPSQRVHLRTGYLGGIKRSGDVFQAEVRGLSVVMEQEKGRIYQYGCDATLGDERCKVDLSLPDFSFSGEVTAIKSTTRLQVLLPTPIADGRLAMGTLEVTSGAAAGLLSDIASHQQSDASADIEVWLPLHSELQQGDSVKVTVGCSKTFQTCRDLFLNQLNFQGFPHMPGNDFVLSYPEQHTAKDGTALISTN